MDIPRIFNITESAHRIHNPFTPDKYATLGAALRLSAGARVLDLGSGSGEMLCTWARDHGIVGTGLDMSPLFTAQAQSRAVELGVAAQVSFIHGDAAGHVADQKVDVAACIGASWIAGGVAGTIAPLAARQPQRRAGQRGSRPADHRTRAPRHLHPRIPGLGRVRAHGAVSAAP